jgi:hypothetical protein
MGRRPRQLQLVLLDAKPNTAFTALIRVDPRQIQEDPEDPRHMQRVPIVVEGRCPYSKPVKGNRASGSLRATPDLYETAVGLMRQNLRRRHPQADDLEIEALLLKWLHHRPGRRPATQRVRRSI